MDIEIKYRPSFALARVALAAEESVVAEAGAMVSMSENIAIATSTRGGSTKGGILRGLKRSLLARESFFLNTFTAQGGPGEVCFAPSLPGDLEILELTGSPVVIQQSSFVAGAPSVAIDASWQGFKGFLGGESLFMLKAAGNGPVVVNSFGAIHLLELDGSYVVDTGHIVAFDESLSFEVKRVGSWKATFFSGEGLVTLFSGKGRLWIQSRNPSAFGRLVGRKLPPREA